MDLSESDSVSQSVNSFNRKDEDLDKEDINPLSMVNRELSVRDIKEN